MNATHLWMPGTLLALALAAAPPLAHAADSVSPAWGQSRGFSAGLQMLIDGITIGEASDPGAPHIDHVGAGLALVGGYSFTPRFHTRLTLGSARHATSVQGLEVLHSVGALDAQYRFLPERQVCPYLMGSLGGADLRADHGVDHVKISAGTAGIGGGLLVGLTRHVAIDIGARFEAVNWKDAAWSKDVPGGGSVQYHQSIEESGNSTRLELGGLWQF